MDQGDCRVPYGTARIAGATSLIIVSFTNRGFVEIPMTDERIRALCAKALVANESEAAAVLAELRIALKEHNEYLRAMALKVLNHSSSKAA